MGKKDSYAGDGIKTSNSAWTFGADVPKNFNSHVKKSVPLYEEGHDLICRLSDYFVKENSLIYDIGVSTGVLTKRLIERHDEKKDVNFVGIDVEEGMVEIAKKTLDNFNNVEIENANIMEYSLSKSDLIICYYTLQFIPPKMRQLLVDKLYESLNWGGALLLFEKTRAPDARFQDICTGIYVDFKLDNGYSNDEIVNKSRSLKGILEPFSTQGNVDLMKRAGFKDMMTIMKFIPFEGFLAIK